MKRKQQNKKVIAWFLVAALCFSSLFVTGDWKITQAKDMDANSRGLSCPVIDAQEGQIIWDSIYFGNYWQSKYIPQPGNRPTEGEDDVVHQDTDGTKFMVREDKSCYRYEPVKWRVLSVNEEGTDAFLIAENTLDVQRYHDNEEEAETVTWEDSTLRAWLNDNFMNEAFTSEEQNAITETEIENKKNPYADADADVLGDGNPTNDKIYLLSVEEATTQAYGFTETIGGTQTRCTEDTDYVNSGGTIKSDESWRNYWLRTLATAKEHVSGIETGEGDIEIDPLFTSRTIDAGGSIRPVLHLDLTKTECWSYAGKVRQDKVEFSPDATPAAATMSPTEPPSVTMEPGQSYPKNPEIYPSDLTQNTWDCIYFGDYYNTKITPSALSLAGEDNLLKADESNSWYLTRREQGYFKYEPIKWRVLSINEDGTDAFLMADQVVDLAQYYEDGTVEITWEKSDIRQWLNSKFIDIAFSDEEKELIKDTTVTTADNRWSGEPGGNDTIDKIYLPSTEEMLEPAYGFSSDEDEEETRKVNSSAYVSKGGSPRLDFFGFGAEVYWLRSPGMKKGYPVKIGQLGVGKIPIGDYQEGDSATYYGVRPVMHVDLSDTTMWKYAGKVTPQGVVEPAEEDVVSPTPTPTPEPSEEEPSKEESSKEPQIKKPGKPSIKQLKNVKGKKVNVTLAKKISGAAGYQVAYATNSSMKKQKVKSFKGTSVTIKGLKKKKTYYFRVRAYKKQSGKTVYSSWGSIKRIKIKK